MPEETRVQLTGDPAIDHTSLKKSLVQGVLWTGGVKWIAQLVSWPIMIIIARLLTPADFGFVALVTVWTRLILLVTEGGVGGAIVFGPSLDSKTLRQLNAIAISLSVAAFAVACVAALPVARFYRSGDLTWVMIAVAGTFLLEGAMLIPTARMRRDMRFRELALADAARAIADSCVTLTLAYLGGRYWSLVGGYVSGVVVVAIISICLCPTGYDRPSWATVGPTLRYAFDLLLTSITSFLYTSSDLLIAGRILGATAVGAYSFAGTLAYAPGEKLVSVLTRVTPSIFGTIGADKASTRTYVEKITSLLAITTLPVLGGIAATAPTLVPLLLGSQWNATIVPLQLVCVHAAVVAVTGIVTQVLQATGNARVVTQNSFLALLVYPPAFYFFGTSWGIIGIAAAWACISPILVVRLVWRMCGVIELSSAKYARMLVPATLSTLWMFGWVRGIAHYFVSTPVPGIANLAVEVGIGIVAYTIAIAILDRDTASYLLKRVIGGRFLIRRPQRPRL